MLTTMSPVLLLATALVAHPAPTVNPLNPAKSTAVQAAAPSTAARALSPAEAKTLFKSAEGPAWRVYHVNGPKKAKGCQATKKAAKLYQARFTCSALYEKPTVMVTPSGNSRAPASKSAE